MIDALATEPHFLEHLGSVWAVLPDELRGRLHINPRLEARLAELGFPDRAAVLERALLVASYGDLKRGRRLGYRRFVLMQHGAGQSYGGDPASARIPNYAGGDDNEDVSLFLVPNRHAAERWTARYPRAAVAIVGSPVLDGLPARIPGGGPVVALSTHWDHRAVHEGRSAFMHYHGMLRKLADDPAFTLIGHGHPRRRDMAVRFGRFGIEYVPRFEDVCRRADLYLADNSSTLFEFASTGRPVIVLDAPFYRRTIDHGLRFWAAADVGLRTAVPRDLPGLIRRALEDPEEVRARREAAVDLVYQPRTGGARLAAAAIVAHSSSLTAVSAVA